MKAHELKIYPEYFEEVVSGRKKFEIRLNDRDFQKGDLVILKEVSPGLASIQTGRKFKAKITYITAFQQKDNYVVFGIEEVTNDCTV